MGGTAFNPTCDLEKKALSESIKSTATSPTETVECAICGGRDEELLFDAIDKMFPGQTRTFPAVRCRRCGLVYLNPRPAPRQRAAFYQRDYRFTAGKPEQAQPLEHYRPIIEFLEAQGPGRLLDIGTGNSPFLPHMRQRGWEVAGTEVDDSLVEHFRSHHQIDLYHGELESARFSSGSFAAVTIMGVLEHVPNPRLLLEEAARILQPGGVLGLWCFNRGIDARLLGRYWLGFDTPRHFYSFSQKTLALLLAETGFELEGSYFRPTSYLLYSGWWAAHGLQERLTGRRRPFYIRKLRALELLNVPIGALQAKTGQSSNIYVYARKAGPAMSAADRSLEREES